MTKDFALFTGCFIPAKLPYLEKASTEVLKKLEINPVYLEFSCCPNIIMKSADMISWLVMAARNLAIAEENNLDILSLCSGCNGTLSEAKHELENKETRKEVNEKLGEIDLEYTGDVNVIHIMNFLYDHINEINENELIKFPVNLSLALHDGCHIQRPSNLTEYEPERMDELVELIGCNVISYPSRDLCCGSPVGVVDPGISDDLGMLKVNEISKMGVDALCTGCPLCFLQYEMVQRKTEKENRIPVFYYPEIIAISMGLHPKGIGIEPNTNRGMLIEKKIFG